MKNSFYPWGGEFTVCSFNSCIAVVLLQTNYTPPRDVAVFGPVKTENIGIEKIVANVISNPNIRYLLICGDDIRGHLPGSTLVALHKYGTDKENRVINAPGAIPYIENLEAEAVERFRKQVEILDLIGVRKNEKIDAVVRDCIKKSPPSFGSPYIAIKIMAKHRWAVTDDKRALHSKIVIDYMGKIKGRGC